MSHIRLTINAVLVLTLVFVGVNAAFAAPPNEAQRPQQAPGSSEVSGQWIVTVDSTVTTPSRAARQAARASGGSVSAVYGHALNGFAIKGGNEARLSNVRGVVAVEPDLQVTTFAQTLPTGVDRIEVDTNATANINGGDERVDADIAVIDTGVELDHPDLNVVSGVDCARGPDCTRGGDGSDGNGHGTHVAGSAAALDNSEGVVGVAPGARIWAVKVLSDDGSGYLSDVLEGIDYVTANADQIEVANLSLGAQGKSTAFRAAIQNSVNAGVFYAVAAGNDTLDVYGSDDTFNTSDDIIPAAYPEVSTISAFTDTDGDAGGNGDHSSWGGADRNNDGVDDGQDDSFAVFSNFSESVVEDNSVSSDGAAIDLVLPGVDILSTWINNGYHTISGTSMASPHGAGLAALYMATNDVQPTDAASVYAVRQALIDNGIAQDSSDGFAHQNDPDNNGESIGWAAGANGTPSVTVTNPSDGAIVSGMITIEADATDDDGSITQVEFFVDNTLVGTDTDSAGGWSADWNTTSSTDGSYIVTAEATDDDPQTQTATDSVTVTVDNNDAPTVSITDPTNGATVSDSITITADASDADGSVSSVEFFVDGSSIGTGTESSGVWEITWDSTTVSDGGHELTAEAMDDDNESSSHSISVNVDNVAEATPVVDSLSLDEDNSGGSPHVDFTISWAVSDGDGNLDAVEMILRDLSDGTVEGSTTVGVSGSSASGTESMKAKFDENSGHEYEVVLTVTDANGNTTTATATEVEDGS